MSGALRAVLVLGLLLGLGRFVEPIPHAVLAGILMKVGWDIIDWRLLRRIHRIRRGPPGGDAGSRSALTVFVDLVTAVAIGLIVAGMAHAQAMEVLELDSVVSVPLLDRAFFAEHPEMMAAADEYAARSGLVALRGSFTVASAHKLVTVVGADIGEHELVIFDFSRATFLDDSAAMLVEQLIEVAGRSQTKVIVMGSEGQGWPRPSIHSTSFATYRQGTSWRLSTMRAESRLALLEHRNAADRESDSGPLPPRV